MVQRLDNAVGEGDRDPLALIPLSDNSKLQQAVKDLKTQIKDLEKLLDSRTKTTQRMATDTKNAIKALEETVKRQAIQNKTMEARLNKLEQTDPPVYTLSALSKSEPKK